MRKNLLLAALFAVSGLSVITAEADNNFSSELLSPFSGQGPVEFTNPRPGWVFFKNGKTSGELSLEGVETRKVKLINGEGFAELPAGRYRVSGMAPAGLTVRTTPALLFYFFAGDFEQPLVPGLTITEDKKYGRIGMYIYHWKYLREKILPSFNMLLTGGFHPALDAWRAEGKKIIVSIPMSTKAENREAAWSKKLTSSRNDGIIVDEFILPTSDPNKTGSEFGYTSPGLGFDPVTLNAVRAVGLEAQKNHGHFYAWLGVPWNSRTEAVKPLFEALREVDGYILWEAYAFSRNYQKEMKIRLLDRTAGFLQTNPKAFLSILIAPSTMEFSDNNAEIDFKVWLDKQLNAMANHADFAGIRGLSLYVAHYTTPEMLRWYAALLRHYALEGRKEMLSDRYGYKLEPGILLNPEWREQLSAWTVHAAEKNSLGLRSPSEWGFKRGYCPKAETALLSMKKVNGKMNTLSQALKNLQPGKLYSLRTMVTAFDRTVPEKVAVHFALSNCEIIEVRLRLLSDYSPAATNRQCWNAYDVVFKYQGGAPVVLTVSDGIGSDGFGPGSDAVVSKEILIDSIRIAPYFSE